jgi:hypothetical protein
VSASDSIRLRNNPRSSSNLFILCLDPLGAIQTSNRVTIGKTP